MSHKKEVSFDFPASVPSTGGNYVRDKAGELVIANAVKQSSIERKAKAIAAPLPASEEGN